MKTWIERALNVHPGDLGRGTLLCSSLFLIITAYKIGGVAAAALFLSRFQARQLAYADIASSVLVAIVVAGYVVIARRVHLRNLLVGSMLFFASNCAVFWVLAHYYLPAGLAFSGVLHLGKDFWSSRAYPDLDSGELRPDHARSQARVRNGRWRRGCGLDLLRLLLQSHDPELRHGKPAAGHGGFRFDLCRSGDPDLAQWTGPRSPEGTKSKRVVGKSSPRNLNQSMRLVFTTPYLRAIAAVICVSSLVTTLTGWQFLAIAQQTLVRKDAAGDLSGQLQLLRGHTFAACSSCC